MAGWQDKLRIRLNSASVEVEAELGNIQNRPIAAFFWEVFCHFLGVGVKLS